MVIGICTLDLVIHESLSLKDKRQVLKSMIDRVRQRFNVSIAEVENQDSWQLATLGFAVVSNETRFNNQVLNKVLELFEHDARLEIVNCQMEML